MKIAIIVHFHYIDVAELIIERLSAAPFTFDLYITTSDSSIAEAAASKLKYVGQISACQVVVGPNRGRNFAQFLVKFGTRLAQYDLLCHIHTKKSLHRSDALRGWGDYLIKNLIGSPELCAETINLFKNEDSCGLAYPETYKPLPFWSEHWLGNFDIARHWAQQYDLHLTPGFVHYPVGGMFWVRPAAIAQLLGHNWSYADFPEEDSQLDGTIHHAVERLIGATSTLNGYQQYAFDPRYKQYRQVDCRNFRSDPNYSADGIARYISAVSCVSFDLFSLACQTRREIEDFALSRVAQDLIQSGLVGAETDYMFRRRLAELHSRFDHRHAGNMGLGEIATRLAVELGIRDVRMLEREADYARDCLEPDVHLGRVYKAASSAGKKIALVAECVYDQAWMEKLLMKFDLSGADYYFTTSQTGGLCADGSIWKAISSKTGCSDWGVLHFGKDVYTDYLLPRNHKIMTIHVPQCSGGRLLL